MREMAKPDRWIKKKRDGEQEYLTNIYDDKLIYQSLKNIWIIRIIYKPKIRMISSCN